MTTVKLDDSTIAQMVRLIQLGILTGTDIADQLRTLELVVKNGKVFPAPEFLDTFQKNLEALQAVADHGAPVSSD
jgi:hypothetical protein